MNRRAFFGILTAGLTAAADPEKLLWEPGRKLISIPKPQRYTIITTDLRGVVKSVKLWPAPMPADSTWVVRVPGDRVVVCDTLPMWPPVRYEVRILS